MKKVNLILIALVAIIGVQFVGCEGASKAPNQTEAVAELIKLNNNQNFVNPYNYIGIEHNQGLEYVYDELLKDENISHENIREGSTRYMVEFLESIGTENPVEDIDLGVQILQGLDSESLPRLVHDYINNEVFSSNVKGYFEEMFSLVEQGMSSQDLSIEMNKICQNASNQLNEDDQIYVFSVASVLDNSYMYWEQNAEKWATMINEKKELGKVSTPSLGGFFMADGIAAVGAIIGGGVSSLIGGPAIGAAAVVGVAFAGSVMYVLEGFLL